MTNDTSLESKTTENVFKSREYTFIKIKPSPCNETNTDITLEIQNPNENFVQKEIDLSTKTPDIHSPKNQKKDSIDLQRECSFVEKNFSQLRDVPEEPLHITVSPSTYCLPEEILSHKPKENEIFRIFFQGTSKEVRIRQIFHHTPITEIEQQWLQEFRLFCHSKHFILHPSIDSFLLRLCYFSFRKYGKKDYLEKALEILINFIHWRTLHLPLSDTEPDILEYLSKGIAYWVARDPCLRPLLVLRLKRLPSNINPQHFKRLIIFCFEWALRYLMVPGIVETCLVMIDTREVALHRYPVSALIDIADMLTRQYPFRLHRMFVISESFFVQILWNAVKPFLTELQQEKIKFSRSFHEILLNISPLHLEKSYGGVREEITTFYPFPLLPGPFYLDTKALNYESKKDCWKLTSRKTCKGVVWENDIRTPVQWITTPKHILNEEDKKHEDIHSSSDLNKEREIHKKSSSIVLKKEMDLKQQECVVLNEEKAIIKQITLPSQKESYTPCFMENNQISQTLPCYQLQNPQEQFINLQQSMNPSIQTTCPINLQNSNSVSFKETKEPSSNNHFNIIRHIKTILFSFPFNCYSKNQTRF